MSFFAALLTSQTFWQQTAPMILFAILLGCALIFGIRRLVGVGSARPIIARRQRGSADSVDFVLTFPFVFLVAMCIAQLALASNASIWIHYSAFSAARAARAQYWNVSALLVNYSQNARRNGTAGKTVDQNIFRYQWKVGSSEACQRAADAARLALMSATPSVVKGQYSAPKGDGCNGSKAWQVLPNRLNQIAKTENLPAQVLQSKARYAFSPQNTQVSVSVGDIVDSLPSDVDSLRLGRAYAGAAERVDALPVTATVTFRYPLILPIGRLFGTVGADGLATRQLSATVRVL